MDRSDRWNLAISAAWFYVASVLTFMNSALLLTDRFIDFLGGLYITQMVDAVGMGFSALEPEGAPRPSFPQFLAFAFDLGVCTLFAVLGTLVLRGRRRALVIGMVWYAVDSMLFLLARQWIAFGTHAVGLLAMSRGFVAIGRYR